MPAEDDPLRRELDERGRVHVAVVGVEAAAEVHVVVAEVIHQVHDQVRLRRRGPIFRTISPARTALGIRI